MICSHVGNKHIHSTTHVPTTLTCVEFVLRFNTRWSPTQREDPDGVLRSGYQASEFHWRCFFGWWFSLHVSPNIIKYHRVPCPNARGCSPFHLEWTISAGFQCKIRHSNRFCKKHGTKQYIPMLMILAWKTTILFANNGMCHASFGVGVPDKNTETSSFEWNT